MADAKRQEQDDIVEEILKTGSLFAVLGLPNAEVPVEDVKKQYRKRALKVHPDKCKHERAKEAFQKLSEVA
jgi:DnaJ family protein C protein 8